MKVVVVTTILGLFRRTWVRITLSNVLIGLAGLFTNLWSNDIAAAPQAPWHVYLVNKYMVGFLVLVGLNTWMQALLEPSSGFRTKADFRETLRRGVSRELIDEMRNVIRSGEDRFLTRDEVKTLLGLDNE
jgi:hypothetical protein